MVTRLRRQNRSEEDGKRGLDRTQIAHRTNLLTSRQRHGFLPNSTFMSSTPEQSQRSLTPEEFPFTAPQLMSRFVTDTGKILPRKYTGLSARHQRAVTKTIKNSRNLLLAK